MDELIFQLIKSTPNGTDATTGREMQQAFNSNFEKTKLYIKSILEILSKQVSSEDVRQFKVDTTSTPYKVYYSLDDETVEDPTWTYLSASFSDLVGEPTDNIALKELLDSKAESSTVADIQSKTLTNTTDISDIKGRLSPLETTSATHTQQIQEIQNSQEDLVFTEHGSKFYIRFNSMENRVEYSLNNIVWKSIADTGVSWVDISGDPEDSTTLTRFINNLISEVIAGGLQLYDVDNILSKADDATKDDYGYITISGDNTSGTEALVKKYYTNALSLEPNTNYNVFVEISDISGTGHLSVVSICTDTEGQFTNEFKTNFNALQLGHIYNQLCLTRSSFTYTDTNNEEHDILGSLLTNVTFAPGQSGSVTFRISVVKDTELTTDEFEYSAYSGGGFARYSQLKDHTANQANPHNVTAEQLGLGNVKTTLDYLTSQVGATTNYSPSSYLKLDQEDTTYYTSSQFISVDDVDDWTLVGNVTTGAPFTTSDGYTITVDMNPVTKVLNNGYNLFPPNRVTPTSETHGGATFTNSDGSIVISGSGNTTDEVAHKVFMTHKDTIALLKEGPITFKTSQVTNPYLIVELKDDNTTYFTLSNETATESSATVTKEMLDNPETTLGIGYYAGNSTPIVAGDTKQILYQDGDGTWEPYTGGKEIILPNYYNMIDESTEDNRLYKVYFSQTMKDYLESHK